MINLTCKIGRKRILFYSIAHIAVHFNNEEKERERFCSISIKSGEKTAAKPRKGQTNSPCNIIQVVYNMNNSRRVKDGEKDLYLIVDYHVSGEGAYLWRRTR